MANNIKISIIVPVYNLEKYIKDTINSVFGQTGFDDYELILVNDGSTDNSQIEIIDCIKTHVKKNPEDKDKVICVKTKNYGAPHARNEGLKRAKGEYILFLDADDVLFPDALLTLSKAMESGIDLIATSRTIFTNEKDLLNPAGMKIIPMGLPEGIYECSQENMPRIMALSPYPCTKLYKKEIIVQNDIIFDDVKIGQDLNFYLKYLGVCKEIVILNKPITMYRIVEGSISHKYTDRIYDITQSIDFVKDYYETHNVSYFMIDDLHAVRIIHYSQQLYKAPLYPNKEERMEVINRFTSAILSHAECYHGNSWPQLDQCIKKAIQIKKYSELYASNTFAKIKKLKNRT